MTELNENELKDVTGGADPDKLYNIHCVKDHGSDVQDVKSVKGVNIDAMKARKERLGYTCTITVVG